MNREIKLISDYDCYSIWISTDGGMFENVDPKGLNISEQLQEKLDAWESRFESTLDSDNPSNSGFTDAQDELGFEKEGVNIWGELISELPDENIIYFSIIDNKEYTLDNYPR